jgi:hypothetical protein
MVWTKLIPAIIVTMAYWCFVAVAVLAQFECVPGDPDYGCASSGETARTIAVIMTVAVAIYALAYWWLWRRHKTHPSSVNGS